MPQHLPHSLPAREACQQRCSLQPRVPCGSLQPQLQRRAARRPAGQLGSELGVCGLWRRPLLHRVSYRGRGDCV